MEMINTPTAMPTPAAVTNERSGQRAIWRSRMRDGWSSARSSGRLLSPLRRNIGGAGGRIASAGGSRATLRTAPIVPSSAATTLAADASANTPMPGLYSRNGNL